MSLSVVQRIVENLYYKVTFQGVLEDGCEGKCVTCNSSSVLRERIKKHLRLVLCDIIILRKIKEQVTPVPLIKEKSVKKRKQITL